MRVELRVESRVELRVQLQSDGGIAGRIEGGIEGRIVLLFCVSPPPPPVMVRKSQEARVYLQMFRLGGRGVTKSRFKFGFQLGLGPGLFGLKKHVV